MTEIIKIEPITFEDLYGMVVNLCMSFDLNITDKASLKIYTQNLFEVLTEYNMQKWELQPLFKKMLIGMETCLKKPLPSVYIKFLIECRKENFVKEEEKQLNKEQEERRLRIEQRQKESPEEKERIVKGLNDLIKRMTNK